jgi:hypothetical protein
MKKSLLALVLLSALSKGVFADAGDRGFYISVAGGGAGSATLDAQTAVVSAATSGGIYFGYKINPSIAIQGGYTSLFSDAVVNLNNVAVGTATISGTEFNIILSRPITKNSKRIFPFLLIGKTNMAETDTYIAGGVQPAISFAGFTYGAGVRFDLGAHFGAQLGYTLYNLKDFLGDAMPLTNGYLALSYKF